MTIPYLFQLQDVRTMHKMGGRTLYCADPGLGKTFGSLLFLHRHPSVTRTVVLCPASVKYGWQREAESHYGWRAEVLEKLTPNISVPDRGIVVLNYDILGPSKHGPGWLEWLLKFNPEMVVIDECQMLSPTAKRTKWARLLCRGAKHILALSGTPFTANVQGLWPTLNILRPSLFPSLWKFSMSFCAPKRVPWGCGWEFKGASNLPQLYAMLKGVMVRRRKEDVLKDLPPKRRSVVPLPMDDPNEYAVARDEFLFWLSQRNPQKLSKAEKAERLVRVGYLKRLAASQKMTAAMGWIDEWLSNTNEKLAVFAIHKPIISQLRERHKTTCVVIDGSTSSKQRQEGVKRFRDDPKVRVFVGNVKAAGVGLDGLQRVCSTLTFLEYAWTPADMQQVEGRLDRMGQENPILIHHLVAKDSIESSLLSILQERATVSSAVLDGGEGDDYGVYDLLTQQLQTEGR